MTLGKKLRELRVAARFSLRELAEKVDSTAPHLSDIEWGRRFPSEAMLIRLARALSVSAEELKTFDTRTPLEDLRRRGTEDPKFAFAMRKVVAKNITGEQLLLLLKKLDKDE